MTRVSAAARPSCGHGLERRGFLERKVSQPKESEPMIKEIMGFFISERRRKKVPKIAENTRAPTLLRVRKNPVKLTALLYLKEALWRERYEQCTQFVQVAKEFGALDREIEELLEDPRRTPR